VKVVQKRAYEIVVKKVPESPAGGIGVASTTLTISVKTEGGGLVPGGSYEVTVTDAGGKKDVGDWYNTGAAVSHTRPGNIKIKVKLTELPEKYELVPGQTDVVETPKPGLYEWAFKVRLKKVENKNNGLAPQAPVAEPISVGPTNQVVETPADQPSAEEAVTNEEPLEEPVEESVPNEAPAEPQFTSEAPTTTGTEQGIVDCFMNLEMYPELVEVYPGIADMCESDTDQALALISEYF
jgi:hypothetical protein